MKRLSNEQLDDRIDSFMGRKMEQFPELRDVDTERPQTDDPYTIHHTAPGWHLTQVTRAQ